MFVRNRPVQRRSFFAAIIVIVAFRCFELLQMSVLHTTGPHPSRRLRSRGRPSFFFFLFFFRPCVRGGYPNSRGKRTRGTVEAGKGNDTEPMGGVRPRKCKLCIGRLFLGKEKIEIKKKKETQTIVELSLEGGPAARSYANIDFIFCPPFGRGGERGKRWDGLQFSILTETTRPAALYRSVRARRIVCI